MAWNRNDRDNFFTLLFKGFSVRDAAGWVNFKIVIAGLALFTKEFLVIGGVSFNFINEKKKENCTHETINIEESKLNVGDKELLLKCDFCKKLL